MAGEIYVQQQEVMTSWMRL